MSSSDIEDVLSSIRRLVTGDLRQKPTASPAETWASTPAPDAPPMPAVPSDPLLLTPALRVVVPVTAQPAPHTAPRPPIDGVVSTIAARIAPPPAGFEAETGDAFDAAVETGVPRSVAATATGAAPASRIEPEARDKGLSHGHQPLPASVENTDEPDEDDAPAPVIDLDEDLLRDLIRDVLREELQGPMGERITRNIRKLVRAELARSAALRQVD